jgi:excisionase family DNA binding protein
MPKNEERGVETGAVHREWISAAQATAFSGLGRTTLWKLASTGQVRAAKVGRAVRFSRSSLQEFMEKSSYTERR